MYLEDNIKDSLRENIPLKSQMLASTDREIAEGQWEERTTDGCNL